MSPGYLRAKNYNLSHIWKPVTTLESSMSLGYLGAKNDDLLLIWNAVTIQKISNCYRAKCSVAGPDGVLPIL